MGRIAVVGAGLIGRAWAISFARAGRQVRLGTPTPAPARRAIGYIAQLLPDLAANGLLGGASPDEALGADHRPGGPRRSARRRRARAGEHAGGLGAEAGGVRNARRRGGPDAVLASSTSASCRPASPRGFPAPAAAWWSTRSTRPYLIPAVEVVPSPWTRPEVVERTARLLREAGHAPIVMARELDGFVMNRMQGALLDEAFRLVAEGGTPAPRTSISASARAWRCAGRSWGRSRPSTRTRQAG